MGSQLFRKLLIANRGEIACRVLRTCRSLEIPTVAVYTSADVGASRHLIEADEAVQIESYLGVEEILRVASETKCEAVHPGYGFLSENPAFSDLCESRGLVFIGPTGESMRAIGDKSQARSAAKSVGVPVTEGLGPFTDVSEIISAAKHLRAPLMLKAAAGGGGKGMKLVRTLDGLEAVCESAQRETYAAFGDNRMIIERYVHPARHIEVQLMADGTKAIALGERECSFQRRHQKIIEESPSVGISAATRQKLFEAACAIAERVGYRNAGTCEFLVSEDEQFYFLEVNARLQVEHPVTELCTGLDLVKMQIEIAAGDSLIRQDEVKLQGHAIEARLCAEDAWNGFIPSAGNVLLKHWPKSVRVDEGIDRFISPNYDSLVAKLIAHAADRESARATLIEALKELALLGVTTNQEYLIQLLEGEPFREGRTYTTTVEEQLIQRPPIPEDHAVVGALALRGPVRPGQTLWARAGDWRLE